MFRAIFKGIGVAVLVGGLLFVGFVVYMLLGFFLIIQHGGG
jgi:hypothetical protein